MTITDQLKIIDDIIKANQAQYDLDRFAAKISAYSSEAKFEYSPLGNIFTEGLDKDDQKEGFFKRLENTKNENVELLKAFSAANKVRKAAKNESDFNYDSNYAFSKFYRGFKIFKRMSLGSKCDEINDFYTLLNAFINTHEVTTTETKSRKNRILNQLYNHYFDLYKKI